jgi:hypothetical protein
MDFLTILLLLINMFFVAEAPLTNEAMQDFVHKMEPYYLESGLPTDTSNTSLSELPNNYWGATVWKDACTNQVYLSDEFTDPNHAFYNTPMWKYVLAHEWAHVAQGQYCWENEAEAQLIALEVLADAGEWGALYTALEWMLTLSAPPDIVNLLQLPPEELRYYQSVNFTQIEAVELLLNDDDGIFQLQTGFFDARNIWGFLHTLPEQLGEVGMTEAR